MTIEEEINKQKVSKGAVVLIGLLYIFLEILIEILTYIPQFISVTSIALKSNKDVDTDALIDEIYQNLSIPWYQIIFKIAVAFLIIYLLKKQHVNFFEKIKLTYANWLEIISLSVGVVAIMWAMEWVIMLINPNFNTANEATLDGLIANTGAVTIFMTVAIIAPIMEEVMVRGLFIGVFFKEKQWLGLLISSLFFAFLHTPTDITSFIIYFVPGVLLGLLYMKTKWLGTPIIAHMLNNLLSLL